MLDAASPAEPSKGGHKGRDPYVCPGGACLLTASLPACPPASPALPTRRSATEPSKGGRKVKDPTSSLVEDISQIPSAKEFEKAGNYGIVTAWCAFARLLLSRQLVLQWAGARRGIALLLSRGLCRSRFPTQRKELRKGVVLSPVRRGGGRGVCACVQLPAPGCRNPFPALALRYCCSMTPNSLCASQSALASGSPLACVQAPREAARDDLHPVLEPGARAQGGLCAVCRRPAQRAHRNQGVRARRRAHRQARGATGVRNHAGCRSCAAV